jgi:ATP-dependent Zn protease
MLLTEMSGIAKPKGLYNKVRVMLGFKPVPAPKYRILWIGATNMAGTLDAALLRPGRFDRRIKVSYPDREGRKVTFQGYLDKIDNSLTETEVETLARENPQATGASIKDAVNEGLLKSAREGREIVTWHDMRSAILWKMMGEEQGEMDTEEDRWGVALHEAAHAVASIHFRPEAPIQFASVIKRDKGTAGFVRSVDENDIFRRKNRLQADVKVSLASVWAEKYFFDDNITTGPSSDLKTATNIVTAMVSRMAMGSTVMIWADPDKIPSRIEEEIQDTLHVYFEEVADFLVPRRDQVEMVAKLLQKHGTVDGIEIHELIERMET